MYQTVDGQAIKGMHDRTRHHIEVAIVGAGFIGVWMARRSKRDRRPVPGGRTGENALARRVLQEDAG
jgi:prephenate dehydrogenase